MRLPSRSCALSWTFCLWLACWAAPPVGAQQTAGPPAQASTDHLLDLLRSDAAVYDKAMACRALAVVGEARATAALAELLDDPQLATYARTALESIPDQSADQALRGSLDQLDGELLIGVLDSIGKRRDAEAVDAVAGYLNEANDAVAAAAARALGRIATAQTAQLLQTALADAPQPRQTAIAMACLMNAQTLLEMPDQREQAVALLEAVRAAPLPEHVRLAAIQRLILAPGQRGAELLAEQLASDQPSHFRLALQTARQRGGDAAQLLIEHYPRLPAARQALTVLALADIGDPAALPLLRREAEIAAPAIRAHAITALGRMNDEQALDVLLAAAADGDAQVAAAARRAIADLQSAEVERRVAELLATGDPKSLLAAIDIAQQRRMASATPALLRLTEHDDPEIRSAAIAALGGTAGVEHLTSIIDLAVSASDAEVRQSARDALAAAGARLPRAESVAILAAALQRASGDSRIMLLEQIAAVGGPEALQAVTDQAQRGDDAMRDAATRLLGEWLSADAAPHLLQLAQTLREPKYRIRALRGYIRCARQLDMSPEQRLEVCRNVLRVADRTEEKQLVFEVLRRYPSGEGLQLAAAQLADPALRDAAARTIVAMADSVAPQAPQPTREALQAVAQSDAAPAIRQQAQQLLRRD